MRRIDQHASCHQASTPEHGQSHAVRKSAWQRARVWPGRRNPRKHPAERRSRGSPWLGSSGPRDSDRRPNLATGVSSKHPLRGYAPAGARSERYGPHPTIELSGAASPHRHGRLGFPRDFRDADNKERLGDRQPLKRGRTNHRRAGRTCSCNRKDRPARNHRGCRDVNTLGKPAPSGHTGRAGEGRGCPPAAVWSAPALSI